MFSIITIWILGSALVGLIGRNRVIGFLPVFTISLVVTPIIGVIVALCSKQKNSISRVVELQELQMRQANAMFHNANVTPRENRMASKADELLKIKQLLDNGVITEQEYLNEKTNILKF